MKPVAPRRRPSSCALQLRFAERPLKHEPLPYRVGSGLPPSTAAAGRGLGPGEVPGVMTEDVGWADRVDLDVVHDKGGVEPGCWRERAVGRLVAKSRRWLRMSTTAETDRLASNLPVDIRSRNLHPSLTSESDLRPAK